MPEVRSWKGHGGPVLDASTDFEVIECGACGFRHVVPLPSADQLRRIYRSRYYTREKPDYLARHREDLDWWSQVYAERYESFEALLPPGRRRILDVGSGPGFFLLHGKQRGWETMGLEPSRQAAAYARGLGLRIVEEFFTERVAEGLGRFDVVHLSELLEHVPDPLGLLSRVRDRLTPGGLVCIVVPNDFNPFQEALHAIRGMPRWWVAPPHHLNYFDFDSLEGLVRRAGLGVHSCSATFPIDLFLLMGEDYVGNEAVGRDCHARRMRLEQSLARAGLGPLKQELYRAFARCGVGREVVLIGGLPAAAGPGDGS